MPRKIVPLSPELPYHVSARSNNQEWFHLPIHEVWAIMENYLFFLHHALQVEVLSFVLMSNHFHLLVRCPQNNLPVAMRYFLTETSRMIGRESDRINHVYGSRFFRSLIQSDHYYRHAYKYVYRNPVRAGLCQRVEDYPYSTLRGLLGGSRLFIPMPEDLILFPSIEAPLKWMNETPPPGQTNSIRRALRKSVYSYSPNRNTGRPDDLESVDY